jgi:glycoside/pentoside/hexuronide:cation symporter, GPH family
VTAAREGVDDVALPRLAVWSYGAVALPLATIGLPLTIYLAPFYAGEMGLSLAWLGGAMVAARLLDMVIDPAIGALSDRWRTPFGRRKPWLVAGSAVLIAGMVQLFHPPPGVTMVHFFVWLGVMYAGFSILGVPHRAWGAELSPYYHERTRIAAVRQFFSTGGLIVSTIVPAIVLSQPGAGGAEVLSSLSLLMVVALPAMVLLCTLFTPEPAPVRHAAPSQGNPVAVWRAIRRNGPLRCMLVVLFVGFSAETFRQTLTVFFARDVIGVPNLGLVYVYYFISAFAGVPLWRIAARRIGKHRALALGMVIAIATNLGIFLLGRGDVLAFTAMFVLKGFCFGALDLLPSAMVADASDVDAAISRQQRTGFLFAIMGVVVNLGQAIGQGLSLNLLELVGYDAAGETGASQLLSLRALYALVPSAILAIALAVTLTYGLTAARHDRLRAALQRRAEKAAP